ncbi:MAG: DUF4145 domain-containing protein [Thermoproteota archaeon]|nr:DUF4145 domain-containing protein [Thermoproteota archaeon]MDQ4100947.1 DUF4145 domain-containing protein [Thermoproteota archaeon]
MAAASEESRRRKVRYCGICKGDKEVINVENISEIERLMTLACEHKITEQLLLVNEKMNISEDTASVILKNPVEEVRIAINDKDYFKTVTYACSVLEYCGQQILIWDSRNKGDPLPIDQVCGWSLHTIIETLFKRKIITDADAAILHSIRGLRNDFIHEDYSIRLTSRVLQKIDSHNDDMINYTATLKAVYDELAAKAEAGAAVTD